MGHKRGNGSKIKVHTGQDIRQVILVIVQARPVRMTQLGPRGPSRGHPLQPKRLVCRTLVLGSTKDVSHAWGVWVVRGGERGAPSGLSAHPSMRTLPKSDLLGGRKECSLSPCAHPQSLKIRDGHGRVVTRTIVGMARGRGGEVLRAADVEGHGCVCREGGRGALGPCRTRNRGAGRKPQSDNLPRHAKDLLWTKPCAGSLLRRIALEEPSGSVGDFRRSLIGESRHRIRRECGPRSESSVPATAARRGW